MRLLFVSSTTIGGSGRSQRELATQLELRGHEVRFLVDGGKPAPIARFAYEKLSDLAVRTARLPGCRITDWLERQPGRRTSSVEIGSRTHASSPVPQNALAEQIDTFRPDIVVCNSLERLAWRRVHRLCGHRDIPTVLYVREIDSLDHFLHGEVPDVLVANAESLQATLRKNGYECAFVPSVIDMDTTRTTSTRHAALVINPIPSKGSDIVWKIATSAPELPILVQESWPLTAEQLDEVERHSSALPNVEFRRASEPGPQLYGDTRVLLVPYRVDSRPRVITEAQSNGIPVLAADVPALSEAIGKGGIIVPIDDIDAWVSELRSLWNDQDRYERLAAAALAHSQRPEIDPAAIAGSFEMLLTSLLHERAGAPVNPDA